MFFFHDPPTTEIYTLSLHDALPISRGDPCRAAARRAARTGARRTPARSEEHTSELQSPYDLVCRLLLEKKKYPRPLPMDCTVIQKSRRRSRDLRQSNLCLVTTKTRE